MNLMVITDHGNGIRYRTRLQNVKTVELANYPPLDARMVLFCDHCNRILMGPLESEIVDIEVIQ